MLVPAETYESAPYRGFRYVTDLFIVCFRHCARLRMCTPHFIHHADAVEEFTPVKGRHQPHAHDHVAHGNTHGRLILVLGADDFIRRSSLCVQPFIEPEKDRANLRIKSRKRSAAKAPARIGYPYAQRTPQQDGSKPWNIPILFGANENYWFQTRRRSEVR